MRKPDRVEPSPGALDEALRTQTRAPLTLPPEWWAPGVAEGMAAWHVAHGSTVRPTRTRARGRRGGRR